jgi:hypothetical protein
MWDEVAKEAVEGLIRGLLSRKSGGPSGHAPGHLEVRSLVLRDDAGTGRAVLAMLDRGPALTLLGPDQGVRAVVGVDDSGPYLQLWGADGRSNLILRLDAKSTDLSLYDRTGVQRAGVELDADGPSVVLRDPEGRCRVQVAVDSNGDPSVTLYDADGQVGAGLSCEE